MKTQFEEQSIFENAPANSHHPPGKPKKPHHQQQFHQQPQYMPVMVPVLAMPVFNAQTGEIQHSYQTPLYAPVFPNNVPGQAPPVFVPHQEGQHSNQNQGSKSFRKPYIQKKTTQGGDQQGVVNYQKYKTSLCRHFEETQECSLGPLCSFAHGRAELRHMNDPLPKDFQKKKGQLGATHSNYKTQLCKNYQETGFCKFDKQCCFAHGTEQLRNLIDPVPPKVPENLLYPHHMRAAAKDPQIPVPNLPHFVPSHGPGMDFNFQHQQYPPPQFFAPPPHQPPFFNHAPPIAPVHKVNDAEL